MSNQQNRHRRLARILWSRWSGRDRRLGFSDRAPTWCRGSRWPRFSPSAGCRNPESRAGAISASCTASRRSGWMIAMTILSL